MNWTEYVDRIVVINLQKRTDRLLEIAEELHKWNIPYELFTAIEKENGAEGLRDSVVQIFNESLSKEHENIVIFEDDCLFVEEPNSVMNNVIKQMPSNYHIIYLGGQVTNGFKQRHSENLIQLDMCFATHAWMISKQGMKEILSQGLDFPIDNCIVQKVQPLQQCYITYPLLATQREGFSNIGGAYINWSPFIVARYQQKIAEFKA